MLSPSTPPNILFILTDDQGPWALGCAGNRELRTPHLDRLAREGTRFENFFCASPVCSPARASILTGRIPSAHGVHDWLRSGNSSVEGERGGARIEYLAGMSGYTDCLAARGWVCGLSGKWHLGDAHRPQKGFGHWFTHAKGGGPYYQAPLIRNGEVYEEPRYVTDVITDDALAFLNAPGRGETPFYLSVHYTAPHSPWGQGQHPAQAFREYHDHCPFESVPDEARHPWSVGPWDYPKDGPQRREFLSGYFTAVSEMDRNVGRLLARLDELGLRRNTLIVFCSDNGMNMGHHGIWGKGNGTYPLNLYEESVRVPLIVSQPGRVRENVVRGELCSQYDLRPTLLEWAGVEDGEADALPGRSFAPLLHGEERARPEHVVVFDEYGPTRMIRDREWKYIHRYSEGPAELYDLRNDPGERCNLAAEPGQQERIRGMRQALEAWFRRWADPRREGVRLAVRGGGQYGPVGTPEGEAAAFHEGYPRA